jgi:hypothetical protein
VLEGEGHHVVASLDDFLCVGTSEEECRATMNRLWGLLRQVGFAINYNKLESPRQHIIFLGIGLDTRNMTLVLADERLDNLSHDLHNIKIRKKGQRGCSNH